MLNHAIDGRRFRGFGAISVAATPIALMISLITYLSFEYVIDLDNNAVVGTHRSVITRTFVLTIIGILSTGITSAFLALLRNEKPRWRAIAGLVLISVTVIVFHFVAVGPNGD